MFWLKAGLGAVSALALAACAPEEETTSSSTTSVGGADIDDQAYASRPMVGALYLPFSETDQTISQIKMAMDISDSNFTARLDSLRGDYDLNAPAREMLFRLLKSPPSRKYFNWWLAYQLANSFLFAPGTELDTVNTPKFR